MKKFWEVTFIVIVMGAGCTSKTDVHIVDCYPKIYPDYTDIHIPYNISPLNFMITNKPEKLEVVVVGKNSSLKIKGGNKAQFPNKKFSILLSQHKNDTLFVSVSVKTESKWIEYKQFYWFVTQEEVDPFLTYRLIEPGYEVYSKLSIRERDLTSFKEKVLADNNLTSGACMNCHTTNKHQPNQSFFHIRHNEGGTFIANGGELRKVDTRTEKTLSPGVYGNWHPSGRFIAFSTNSIKPEFFSVKDKRMEVYDTTSDLIILDIENNQVFSAPEISMPGKFETFPEFSADGKSLFFCVADSVQLPEHYKKLMYSLVKIDFEPKTRTFSQQVDTLFSVSAHNKTVSQPKASPDGKYIMFTVFDYGTFPVWHNEAALYLMHLESGEIDTLPIVNEKKYSNSYHSWSSNSSWFVFASKRDNGLYGKPYFAYVRQNGQATKPFVLPQYDPEFYDYFTKSFNIPELLEKKVKFDAMDVERVFHKIKAEKVDFIEIKR